MQALATGQIFGRYHVLSQMGTSSAGNSYVVADSYTHDPYVLKILHPWGTLSDAQLRTFFSAMRNISLFDHPLLTTIFDYGQIQQHVYLVRQYSHAGSLLSLKGQSIFHPPLAIIDAFTYAEQVARTLYYIHNNGLTHGALTFANILVCDKESSTLPFLIADAGISQLVKSLGSSEKSFYPFTASPEHFTGQVSPYSDQYSLAVLLYFWLTGRAPFSGTPATVLQLKHAASFPSPRTFNEQVTRKQERILRRALHPDPSKRFPSVLEFATQLLETIDQDETLSPPVMAHTPATITLPARMTDEQEKPSTPPEQPPVTEPVVPQPDPLPGPTPIPEPTTEPQEPVREPEPPEVPIVDPDVVPTPAPDIAQPFPAETPFTEPPPTKVTPTPAQPQTPTTPPQPDAYVVIISPYTAQPHTVSLNREELTIGRAGSSDIILDHNSPTSRHHALIKQENEQYLIYDLRSDIGTQINHDRLIEGMSHPLHHGDFIRIGDYHLIFMQKPKTTPNKDRQSQLSYSF